MENTLRHFFQEIRSKSKVGEYEELLNLIAKEIETIVKSKPTTRTFITKDGLVRMDTSRTAKSELSGKGEYSVTASGRVRPVLSTKNTLWSSGCHPVVSVQRIGDSPSIGGLPTFEPMEGEELYNL